MRQFMWIGLALCAVGALWRAEEEEDGAAIALSPFLAALGWPKTQASDAAFVDHLVGMVDAYWSRPR